MKREHPPICTATKAKEEWPYITRCRLEPGHTTPHDNDRGLIWEDENKDELSSES